MVRQRIGWVGRASWRTLEHQVVEVCADALPGLHVKAAAGAVGEVHKLHPSAVVGDGNVVVREHARLHAAVVAASKRVDGARSEAVRVAAARDVPAGAREGVAVLGAETGREMGPRRSGVVQSAGDLSGKGGGEGKIF